MVIFNIATSTQSWENKSAESCAIRGVLHKFGHISASQEVQPMCLHTAPRVRACATWCSVVRSSHFHACVGSPSHAYLNSEIQPRSSYIQICRVRVSRILLRRRLEPPRLHWLYLPVDKSCVFGENVDGVVAGHSCAFVSTLSPTSRSSSHCTSWTDTVMC